MSGCSLKLEYLKGLRAHLCIEGCTVVHSPWQGRQPFQLLQQQRQVVQEAQTSPEPRVALFPVLPVPPPTPTNNGRVLQLPQACRRTAKGQGRDVR